MLGGLRVLNGIAYSIAVTPDRRAGVFRTRAGTVRTPQLVLTPNAVSSPALRGRIALDLDFDKAVGPGDLAAGTLPVWPDLDKDGVRSFSDPYTITRTNGEFAFVSLGSGTQRVAFTASTWLTLGGVRYVDVGPAATPVRDLPIYAFNQQIRVVGMVRLDANGNNTLDASDPVVSGAPIATQQQKTFATPTISGPDGRFVGYGAAGPWSPTLGIVNGYSVISVSPAAATLAVGDTSAEYTVFIKGPSPALAGISGAVFDDGNFNGKRENGESGLRNFQVWADLDGNAAFDDADVPGKLTSTGVYSLAVPPNRATTVYADLPTGYAFTGLAAVAVPAGTKGVTRTVNLLVSDGKSAITGRAYYDYNQNGTLDSGEAPTAGRRVWIDTDGDDTFDADERQTTSDADGYFAFAATGSGDFRVVQDKPAGESGVSAIDVAVKSGGAVGGLTFGGATVPGTTARFGVGDGSAQRSRISNAIVTLGDMVTLTGLADGAFTLTQVGYPSDTFTVQATAVAQATGGGTAVTLAFAGPGLVGIAARRALRPHC